MEKSKEHFPTEKEWAEDFTKYFDAKDFKEMELDDQPTIGYTFKAMGAAILAFRQFIQSETRDEKVFASVLNAITLEAGDADSNACVAGSLMGLCLGLSHFPSPFLVHLPHFPELSRLALFFFSNNLD
eukprot:TRINITY_DN17108_c0_g1_i1.p2 TRINITY_DN17108_c0_g1~~TRINITY_DN17108_c0_g1_i1.p2  ORF type:complete len:138 (+),score=55.01 TRINITY_DN17108_c0_g1_i1:32-415(+)